MTTDRNKAELTDLEHVQVLRLLATHENALDSVDEELDMLHAELGQSYDATFAAMESVTLEQIRDAAKQKTREMKSRHAALADRRLSLSQHIIALQYLLRISGHSQSEDEISYPCPRDVYRDVDGLCTFEREDVLRKVKRQEKKLLEMKAELEKERKTKEWLEEIAMASLVFGMMAQEKKLTKLRSELAKERKANEWLAVIANSCLRGMMGALQANRGRETRKE